MATLTPIAVEEKPKLGGGGPTFVPARRGGGGAPDHYRDRLRRYRIGLFFALAGVVMLFVGFTSAYIVRQGMGSWDEAAGRYVYDWRPLNIPPILWINTALLVASSFTLVLARRSLVRRVAQIAGRGPVPLERTLPWLEITLVLGLGFLAGQLLAWRQLAQQGIFISTNPSSSFFYVLTGAHGLHLLGGILALVYATMTSLLRKPLQTRFIVVDVTALYWHFMGFLWIYIFALLHFAR